MGSHYPHKATAHTELLLAYRVVLANVGFGQGIENS